MALAAATPLESLLQAIERFVRVPSLELTAAELGEHLVRLRHGIDLLELGFATGAASFAATDEYDAQGSVSPIDWIRHHCHMSSHAAARAVAAGEQVGRLPGSVAALDAGKIGFAHFSLLAGVARTTLSGKVTELSEDSPQFAGYTIGPDGNHWWMTSKGTMRRTTPSGQVTNFRAYTTLGFWDPAHFVFGPDKNIWYVDGGVIDRMTLAGT
jgi:hypothetical protein